MPSLSENTPPSVAVTGVEDPWLADELASFREQNGREVRLNARELLEPATLFRAFAREMPFPDYFGHNWDALVDCLSDPYLHTSSVAVLVDDADLLLGAEHLGLFVAVLCQAAGRPAFDPARAAMHLVLLLDEVSPAQFEAQIGSRGDVATEMVEGQPRPGSPAIDRRLIARGGPVPQATFNPRCAAMAGARSTSCPPSIVAPRNASSRP